MEYTQTEKNRIITSLVHISIVLAVALGIRVYLWTSFPHVIFLHEADAMGYIGIARNIIEHFSISNSTHFPPFYPALIALSSLVVGNYEYGARWASIVMGAGMVVPLYLACRYLMSSRAAFCASLLAACFDPFVDYSVQPISQATYAALIALGVWLGLRCARRPSPAFLAAFGMTAAAIYLTRPEGILFFAFNFPLLMYVVFTDKAELKQQANRFFALSAGFLVPFVWYVVCLRRYSGNWSISGKSGITSIGIDASLKLLPDGRTYGASVAGKAGLADLFPSVAGFAKTFVTQSGKFALVAYSTLPGILLVLAAAGSALLVYEMFRQERSNRMKSLCLLGMFFSPLILLAPVMVFDKISLATGYILPFFIVFFCCSAKGIVWLESVLVGAIDRRHPVPTVLKQRFSIAVIATALLSWYSYIPVYQRLSSEEFSFMSGQQDFLLRQTGHWLTNNTDKNAKIMARWSNIGYYGGRGWIALADGSIGEVTRYAKRNGVTHIVIDSDAVPRRRPQLKNLLEPSIPQPGLTPVYLQDQFDTRVVIYQVE